MVYLFLNSNFEMFEISKILLLLHKLTLGSWYRTMYKQSVYRVLYTSANMIGILTSFFSTLQNCKMTKVWFTMHQIFQTNFMKTSNLCLSIGNCYRWFVITCFENAVEIQKVSKNFTNTNSSLSSKWLAIYWNRRTFGIIINYVHCKASII